jgi:hypothetical protein
MWELLTGEEPYADMHYGAIIGEGFWFLQSILSVFQGSLIS